MPLAPHEAFRKGLLPKWVKFFAWLFLIAGSATPAVLVSGAFYTAPMQFGLFGWEHTGSPYDLQSLLVLIYFASSGVTAFGMLWGRRWGWIAGFAVGSIGLALALGGMFLKPLIVNNKEEYGIYVRLEPLFQIPFLWTLWRIRKSWFSPPLPADEPGASARTNTSKVVAGLVLSVSLVVIFVFALLLSWTSGLTNAAGQFLEAVRANDMTKARSYLSKDTRAEINEGALKRLLAEMDILDFEAAHWPVRRVSGQLGELKGTLSTASGDDEYVELTFVKEGEEWKISHLKRPEFHSTPRAIEAIRTRAESGNVKAQYKLGGLYYEGNGVAKNDIEAARWFRKAAEQGYANAEYNLGAMCANGEGGNKDSAQSFEWFRKAADHGFAEAQFVIGKAYAAGGDVDQDYAAAASWYRKAAEQGYANAQVNLGVLYNQGHGVPVDSVQAVAWFRKAAEQHFAIAQFNLGNAYEDGRGVQPDVKMAVAWYRKAAEQGLADAQFNLGVNLSQGIGAEQDYAEAATWYRKAAEQDMPEAQNNLALAYIEGKGVSRSDKEAYFWLLLSSRNYEDARPTMAAVQSRLKPADIAEVKVRAAQWQP